MKKFILANGANATREFVSFWTGSGWSPKMTDAKEMTDAEISDVLERLGYFRDKSLEQHFHKIISDRGY